MPGAGKTSVLVLLTLALLNERHAPDPVPVLLTPGSWDPRSQPFLDWLGAHLANQYPFLRRDGARALVDGGRVLPLLDGLDELSVGSLGAALTSINRTGVQQPLIVACRSLEFAQAVYDGDVLTGAAVVQLEPVEPEQVQDYLRRTTPRDDRAARWEPVFAQLRRTGPKPLMEALSTPLMVSLARTIYALDRTADPGELADRRRFPAREAIEDHLLDGLVETVFKASRERSGRWTRPWNPEQAQRWLIFLARHLDRRDTRDLVWWHLHGALPPMIRAVAVGAFGAVALGVVGAGMGVLVIEALTLLGRAGEFAFAVGPGVRSGSVIGLAFGLAGGLVAGTTPVGDPVQTTLRLGGRCRTGVQTAVAGLLTGLWSGLAFGLLFGVAASIASGVEEQAAFGLDLTWTVPALILGLLFGAAAGLGFSLLSWVQAPIEASIGADPRSTQRDDRIVALVLGTGGGALLGIVFGMLLALLLTAPLTITVDVSKLPDPLVAAVVALGGLFSGSRDLQLVTGVTAGFAFGAVFAIGAALLGGLPPAPYRAAMAVRGRRWAYSCVRGLAFGLLSGCAIGLAVGMPAGAPFALGLYYGLQGGIAYALVDWLMGGMARAWPSYMAAAAWLSLRGRMPWRLMTFLEDMHKLGILRQVGAVYQFRHARLQDRLASVGSPATIRE